MVDMATPVIAEGKVRVALNRGAELPPGSIVDGDGRPSTDPHDFYGGDPPGSRAQGALLPIGAAPPTTARAETARWATRATHSR